MRLQIQAIRTMIHKADNDNILANLAKTPNRLEQNQEIREEEVAVVGYGTSLTKTWELLKGHRCIISTSGAHDFLIERGIIPTWHIDCDPRAHKARFTSKPHSDVTYLIASSAHPSIVDQLLTNKLKLWNMEVRPHVKVAEHEWELRTYGDVGQMAIAIAKVLGFRKVALYGMDYSFGQDEQHAGVHGREDKTIDQYFAVDGKYFKSNMEFIKNLMFFEILLDENPDLEITITGNGLLSHFLEAKHGKT